MNENGTSPGAEKGVPAINLNEGDIVPSPTANLPPLVLNGEATDENEDRIPEDILRKLGK